MRDNDLVDAVRELQQNQNEMMYQKDQERANEAARQHLQAMKDLYSTLISSSSSYTNLIIVAGYAGFLSLLSSFNGKMQPFYLYVSGFFIVLSLTFFIAYEVFKMTSQAMFIKKVVSSVNLGETDPVYAVENLKEYIANYNMINSGVWFICFLLTIIMGAIATAFLLYSIFVHIIDTLPPEVLAYF